MTSDKLYHYRATFLRAVDGDTIDVELDHGFERMRSTRRLRLLGVDTPERGQQGYHEATALTFDQLEAAQEIIVRTVSKDSFGRWLAEVWCDGVSLNQQLIDRGWPWRG